MPTAKNQPAGKGSAASAPPPPLPLKRRLKKLGIRLIAAVVPGLYRGYMRLVVATSRLDIAQGEKLFAQMREGKSVVLAILHQHCVAAPYLFRGRGICTVANVGDAGDVISALLAGCAFSVVRGGSSNRASRRTPVVRDLIRFGRSHKGSMIALTPDGSRGPAGACKPGLSLLTMETGAALYCANIHASRAWYLPTWDRLMLPLPFGELRLEVAGPIEVPAAAKRDQLNLCRAEIEHTLHELHARAFARHGKRPVPVLTAYEQVRRPPTIAAGPPRQG